MSSLDDRYNERADADDAADVPSDSASTGGIRWQLVAWVVLVTGLMVWLATGTVSTTSYTSNFFLGVTYRNVTDEALQQIWVYQAEHLPTVQYQALLDAGFVLSVVAVVACVIAGSWLLLVKASRPGTLGAHRFGRSFPTSPG